MSETTITLSAQIVAAFVGKQKLAADQLPALIRSVHTTLVGLDAPAELPAAPPTPAVPIKRSIQPEYLICLEDGLQFKSMKRHLRQAFGLTPAAYRKRWGLPADYPMVAPRYHDRRSELAKATGLGKH